MKLRRKLGFWGIFCIASGAMISSGLFVLPGLAFRKSGPAMLLAYALAGLMAIPAAMSQAELASAMPRSGGSYFFIERSMGSLPGIFAGLANWLSISLKSAFALIGIGAFAQLIWPDASDWHIKLIAIGCCVFFMALNIISVKQTGKAQIIMVAILLSVLGIFVVFGIGEVKHSSFENFMDKGMKEVLATAGLVFVSFGGLTKIASVAGEVRNPGRTLPAGMFAALIIVSLVYVAAIFVTEGVLEPAQLYDEQTGYTNYTPLSTAANVFLAKPGMILLALAGMLAFITTANSGILTASRSPMAMSHDGLLPAIFQKTSARFGTPVISIVITGAFMIVVIAALSISNLVKVASTMMLMLFAMVNLAVIIMRGSKIQNYRPLYRCPFYPWFQIIGIVLYIFLITEMGAVPLITTGIFALIGVMWYVIYIRPRIDRESAFIYMVKNIVSKEIYRSELEEELREIALERDEVTHDRFDQLISNCAILDIEGSIDSNELFNRAADALAPRLDTTKEELLKLFLAREKGSSTVIQPGLAIPHVIVEGDKLFDILLVRCKDGVLFPQSDVPVQTAFVLVGSADQRNYHLRALMAVAHIVQEHGFTERWLSAPHGEHLRDIVLLSSRQRDV